MTGCKLVSHMVHEGPPYYATGAMKALHHCQTHNMSVQDGEQLCPIGKVEKAVDDGLGRISTALEGALEAARPAGPFTGDPQNPPDGP